MNTRNYGIDFLKFLAAIMITNSHFIPLYKDINISLATFGVHGNALFFFVAGFLSTMCLNKKNERFDIFVQKRIRRIWPAVAIWVTITAITLGEPFKWQNLLLLANYWFLQTIIVYYFIFYFVGKMILKTSIGGVMLYIFTLLVSIFIIFFFPKVPGSIFHSSWHFVCHFPAMVLGGIVFKVRTTLKTSNSNRDRILLMMSFILYFVIMHYGKGQVGWKYYTQILCLFPLQGFCYYSYKVCTECWCKKLMNSKLRYPLTWISALTLEIYVVQFHIITDFFNSIFPISLILVFTLILIAAFMLRIFVNIFLHFFNTEDMKLKELFKI